MRACKGTSERVVGRPLNGERLIWDRDSRSVRGSEKKKPTVSLLILMSLWYSEWGQGVCQTNECPVGGNS